MTTSHSMPEHHVLYDGEAVPETPVSGPGTAADQAAGDDLDVLILEPDQYTAENAPGPAAETVPDLVAGPTSTIFEPATARPTSTTAEPDTVAEPPGALAEPDAMSEPPDAMSEPPDAMSEPVGALVEPPGTPPDDAFAADIPPTNPDYRWREIQAMFVDDPRGSVERAAELAGDALRDLNNMLRERERDLRATWQDPNADTEELRTSLQGYRALVGRISELAQQR
jgi:hypothetical protein